MGNQQRHVATEVAALRKLMKRTITPRSGSVINWDYYCYYFCLLNQQFGSNVITVRDFTEAAGLNVHNFNYHLKLYKKCEKVAAGALAGEAA